MARVLIVGGGGRGRELGRRLRADGHAVRITTRRESGRSAIEALGAECWVGDPDVIASLRQGLDGVTVVCWLLGCAVGAPGALAALHGSRLDMFLTQVIDTTVRGLIYEAAGTVDAGILAAGARAVAQAGRRSQIPYAVLDVDPADHEAWDQAAGAAIATLLGTASPPVPARG